MRNKVLKTKKKKKKNKDLKTNMQMVIKLKMVTEMPSMMLKLMNDRIFTVNTQR